MKKGFKSVLLLLGILLFVTSCGRIEDPDPTPSLSEETRAPGENGCWDLNDLVWGEIEFPIEGLYGVPRETLLQAEAPACISYPGGTLDTADCFLFQLIRSSCPIPIVYDKSTGRFTYACIDPLCTHHSCIWSGFPEFYRGGDELFLVRQNVEIEGMGEWTVYSCGPHGENARKLYEGAGRIKNLIKDGEYLYFLEESYDEDTEVTRRKLMRLHILGKTVKELLPDVWWALPMGDRLLYTTREQEGYFYEIETGEKTLFSDSCSPVAYHRGWIYYHAGYSEDYTAGGGLYRASAENPSVHEQVLDRMCNHVTFAGDRIYYVKSEVFDQREGFSPYNRHTICSSALDGSDQKVVWDMEPYATDGIPVNVNQMHTDGKMLHVEYETYRDFKNMYNPDFGSVPGERGDLYELLIDLSTGEVLPFMGSGSMKYNS